MDVYLKPISYEKIQNTTVKRFLKVGYNVNFEFHETKVQNELGFNWYHQIEMNMQC